MIDTELKQVPYISLFRFIKPNSERFKLLSRSPQKFPGLFAVNFFGQEIRVIHQPEMVQHILVRNSQNYKKDRGYQILALFLGNGLITNADYASWRKQRTLLQPPFHRESLDNMCKIVAKSLEHLLEQWKQKEGTVINLTQEMAWLTIDIVSKTLFTTDVSEEHIQMIWESINYLNAASMTMIRNPYHIPWKFPIPRHIKARKYISGVDNLIYSIIHKRKQQKNPPRDLLQLLIEARYEDGTAMSDEQIRDEVITVFVAGHETTVNALSWTWYLLKQNKVKEQKLKEESQPFATQHPGFSDIPKLSYGWQVMNEAMRLYPPVPAIGRAAVKDDESFGYELKAETITVINISGLHHHPAYWQNPFEFMPERFEHFELKGDNRYIFMPFGAGPRICIGNNFAMMEMQLINAILAARVDMELVSNEVAPEPLITLKPQGGVIMKLKKVN